MLQPTCSEAVFRLGGRKRKVHTDDGSDIDRFAKSLCRIKNLDDYEPIENLGGGAHFDAIELLIELRKELGDNYCKVLRKGTAWKFYIDDETEEEKEEELIVVSNFRVDFYEKGENTYEIFRLLSTREGWNFSFEFLHRAVLFLKDDGKEAVLEHLRRGDRKGAEMVAMAFSLLGEDGQGEENRLHNRGYKEEVESPEGAGGRHRGGV